MKEPTVKGPGMRLDYDVRRIWRCPACGAERRTLGDQTVLSCSACSGRPLMTLVERPRPARRVAGRPDLIIGLHPDDVDSPPYLPARLASVPLEDDVQNTAVAESPPETGTASPPRDAGQPDRYGKRQSRRRPKRSGSEREAPQTQSPDTRVGDSSLPAEPPPPAPAEPAPSSGPDAFGDGVLDGS